MNDSEIIYRRDGIGVFPVDLFPNKIGDCYLVSREVFFDYTLGNYTLQELVNFSTTLSSNLDNEEVA